MDGALVQVTPVLERMGRWATLKNAMRRAWPRPVLGAIVMALAVVVTVLTWSLVPPASISWKKMVLLVLLSASVTASRRYPIRIGKGTRLNFASISLFCLTCLYVPPLAAAAVGVGMLAGELSVCRVCGNGAGEVLGQVGRWMLLVCGVSALVHLWSTDMLLYTAAVVAILLWTGDVLTCPVVVSPLTGKDPASMVVLAARQSYLGDLMRYLVALFGLLFFISDLRSAGFWLRDVEGALLLILPMFLLYPYLKSEEEMQQTCISDEELYAGEPVTLGRHILD